MKNKNAKPELHNATSRYLDPWSHPHSDAGDRLLEEIGRWIKAMGGLAVVAGPIRLVEWPEDTERNASETSAMRFFSVDVKVMGRRPVRPESSDAPPIETPPPHGVKRRGTVRVHAGKPLPRPAGRRRARHRPEPGSRENLRAGVRAKGRAERPGRAGTAGPPV